MDKKTYNKTLQAFQNALNEEIRAHGNIPAPTIDKDESRIAYQFADVPKVGDFKITFECYDSAKAYKGKGVKIFTIYTRYETFTDPDNLAGIPINKASGKRNFHIDADNEEDIGECLSTFIGEIGRLLDMAES